MRRLAAIFMTLCCLSSCALPLARQSEVANLVAAKEYTRAAASLDDNLNAYGKNNRILYLLDKGMVSHLTKDYTGSIAAFAAAKNEYDSLTTKSLSRTAATWLVNDHAAPYQGEDFERAMINVFLALNYAQLGDIDEALVEARDADAVLNLINDQYPPDKKNTYKEDAFLRLLCGILYEASGTPEGTNDAYISYAKAAAIYENDYVKNYGVGVPDILKENILAAAKTMGPAELDRYRRKFGDVPFLTLEEKKKKAQVYIIQYCGLAPLKTEETIPLWFPEGTASTIAFPVYETRPLLTQKSTVTVMLDGKKITQAATERCQDISAIAVKNLANRKVRTFVKAAASGAGKILLEKTAGEAIGKKAGNGAEQAFMVLAGATNLFSNRADTRSWQTLPSEIRIARLFLNEGSYDLFLVNSDATDQPLENINLGKLNAAPGETKFIITASSR
jgi:hypothetical protein